MTLLLLHLVRNGLVFTRVVYWMTPYFGEYTFYLIGPYFWLGVGTYLSLQIGSAPRSWPLKLESTCFSMGLTFEILKKGGGGLKSFEVWRGPKNFLQYFFFASGTPYKCLWTDPCAGWVKFNLILTSGVGLCRVADSEFWDYWGSKHSVTVMKNCFSNFLAIDSNLGKFWKSTHSEFCIRYGVINTRRLILLPSCSTFP